MWDDLVWFRCAWRRLWDDNRWFLVLVSHMGINYFLLRGNYHSWCPWLNPHKMSWLCSAWKTMNVRCCAWKWLLRWYLSWYQWSNLPKHDPWTNYSEHSTSRIHSFASLRNEWVEGISGGKLHRLVIKNILTWPSSPTKIPKSGPSSVYKDQLIHRHRSIVPAPSCQQHGLG